jgi:PfaD family protein
VTAAANGATRAPELATDPAGIYRVLCRLDQPCYVVATSGGVAVANAPPAAATGRVLAAAGPLPAEHLGSGAFRTAHGLRYAYVGGAMAAGIASERFVTALVRAGYAASFGAGGLPPDRVEDAVRRLSAELTGAGLTVNLLHAPHEPALERGVVATLLRHRVRCVEASGFIDLTPPLVHYRVAGLERDAHGRVRARNRVLGKVSRPEVAGRFLLPPPEPVVAELVAAGLVTAEQAALARQVRMAEDVTVESDSGGHTDRRSLTSLFPIIGRLRDELARDHPDLPPARLGAAGGIGTPHAVAAAFALGADYVLTGSVNQACAEAGTSERARRMLSAAGCADFQMAPSADMFEVGAQVQVLARGTMFPARARRLRQLYEAYPGLEAIPPAERGWLEQQVFRCPVEEVWQRVVEYFQRRDPDQISRAVDDPKRRMALVFRWYLGLSSRWAAAGDPERAADYQLWSGPALASFNDWVRGSYLADVAARSAVDVAHHLMRGAAFSTRVHQLRLAGVRLPAACADYRPAPIDR